MLIQLLLLGISTVVGAISTLSLKNYELKKNIKTKRKERRAEFVSARNELQVAVDGKMDNIKQEKDGLDNIVAKIKEEEKKITIKPTFSGINNDEHTKFIVALGNTGYGKSTVLNRLNGDDSECGDKGLFAANGSDESVTQNVQHIKCNIRNIKSILVDTPGYNDTNNQDDVHFNNLASYLYGSGGVDAFLLVMNGTNRRFDRKIKTMLECYGKYFGLEFWDHLIIILTHIESHSKKQFIKNKRASKLQQKLKKEFGINHDIPIISIGYDDNYTVFCNDVMNSVISISTGSNYSKAMCKEIKSPIKQLKVDRNELQDKVDKLNKEAAPLTTKWYQLNQKIDELNNKLENPQKFPLFSNHKATI